MTFMRFTRELKDDVAEVNFPGFHDDDFNNRGTLRADKLSSVFEAGSRISVNVLNLSKIGNLLGRNRTLFGLGIDYVFSRGLYTSASGRKSFPFTISTWVSSSGNTSFTIDQSLTRVGDTEQLARATTRLVCVHSKTRRPIPISEEVREIMPVAKPDSEKFEIREIPEKHFFYDIEIQPSDIDDNFHTNQSKYIRFCSDCALVASASGFFTDGIHRLVCSEMRTLFVGESRNGDLLRVYTWEDFKSPEIIYFVISKQDSPIFHCRWKRVLERISSL